MCYIIALHVSYNIQQFLINSSINPDWFIIFYY